MWVMSILGAKWGRASVLGAVCAAAVFGVGVGAYRAGKQACELDQALQVIETKEAADRVRTDVDSKSADDVRNSLSEWLRDIQ